MDLGDRLQNLVDSTGFAPLAFVFAFLAGAAHAVGPGHGKTLAAAFLVGEKGRLRDAIWLSGSVALMHTVSVLVIAIGWTFYSLSDLVELTTLTTVLQLAAGLLTVGTGLWLLRRNLRGTAGTALHSHGGVVHSHRDGIVHTHAGHHSHDHAHSHSTTTTRRPGVVILGAAGGLVPSPTAFLVLITGFFSGHAAFAVLLVLTFGIGMAIVLLGVGLLALGGSSLITRGARSRSLLKLATRIAPAVAGATITAAGAVIVTVAIAGLAAA